MALTLTDKGMRYTHYVELLDLWESTLELLKAHRLQTVKSKEKQQQLTAAVEIMRKQIDVLSDYEDNLLQLRRDIESAHASVTDSKSQEAAV